MNDTFKTHFQKFFLKAFARCNSKRGFSILELMIVVVIVGLVAAMAGPRFSKEMDRMKFRGDARNAVSTLRLARSLAITNKTDYGVVFSSNGGTITLFKDIVRSDPPAFNAGDSVIQIDTISGDYPIATSSFTGALIYYANGSASESGKVLLLCYTMDGLNSNTCYATLDVLAATGRAKITDIQFY